jgi:hypothetical protein
MTDRVRVSGEVSGSAGEPAEAAAPRQFGLAAAMAPIVGSIIGVGIFNLPTSLAGYGPITLVPVGLTITGITAALPYGCSAGRPISWRLARCCSASRSTPRNGAT